MPWPWGVETWKFCDYFTFFICHEGPEAWGFPQATYKACMTPCFFHSCRQQLGEIVPETMPLLLNSLHNNCIYPAT